MRIIKPSVEFWGRVPTDYEGNLALIERAGRLCYKSEDRIAPGTAEPFVSKLTSAGHWAMLEHSNLVVRIKSVETDLIIVSKMKKSKYLSTHISRYDDLYIGGNLRAWLEALQHNSFTELYAALRAWICPHDEIPAEFHRYTVKFICDRGVSHELVRHRPCSFAQESTRYCDYRGQDIQFVEPYWLETADPVTRLYFFECCRDAEEGYKGLRDFELTPQAARAVLPHALKTEIVVTADAKEWQLIRRLRLHKAAHPDIQRVMAMVPWEKMGL